MIKIMLFSALTLSFSSISNAGLVYTSDIGSWHLRGYIDPYNADNNSCVLSTSWDDQKAIRVNVFPKADGSSNVTMTIFNPHWNDSLWQPAQTFTSKFNFASAHYGDSSLTGFAQVSGKQRLIFRGLNKNFAYNFIHSDSMTIFAGTVDELAVDLTGTAAIALKVGECKQLVSGAPEIPDNSGSNH